MATAGLPDFEAATVEAQLEARDGLVDGFDYTFDGIGRYFYRGGKWRRISSLGAANLKQRAKRGAAHKGMFGPHHLGQPVLAIGGRDPSEEPCGGRAEGTFSLG